MTTDAGFGVDTPAVEQRAVGCLLAAACGDALGGGVEFMSREELADACPDGVRNIVGGGPWHLAPGEETDDTQMALAIARACTRKGIDLDQVAANFVTWFRGGPKDVGNATREALALIAAGVPWQEAGEQLQHRSPDGVAGNGTVMRCAPLAVRFRSSSRQLRRATVETARMTHADPLATEGAVALNQGIGHLLDGGGLDGVVDAATRDIGDTRVTRAIRNAPALQRIDLRSGGYVLDTLASAFWCLLNHGTLEDVIVAAVMLGDDTDTTATVAGALAGAHWGAGEIPARWTSILLVRNEVIAIARQLHIWNECDAGDDTGQPDS